MSISGVSPVRASAAVRPTLDQVAHEYWQELVVLKMKGAPLYWDEPNQNWTARVDEATQMTRRDANQQSPDGRLHGYVVTLERAV